MRRAALALLLSLGMVSPAGAKDGRAAAIGSNAGQAGNPRKSHPFRPTVVEQFQIR
jgi:hypothetical protein